MPFLLVGFMFQLRMMMTDMLSFKKSLEKSSKTAVEAINNIRTVAGLRCEEKVIGEYARALQEGSSMAHSRLSLVKSTSCLTVFIFMKLLHNFNSH